MTTVVEAAGDPGRAIVLSLSAQAENGSSLARNLFAVIADKPGIARDASGKPLAEAEILSSVTMYRKEDGLPNRMGIRGMGPQSIALRPKFKLIQGRMFRPGARELIVGHAAQGQFARTQVGDKVIQLDGEWPVVGVFTMDGDISESTFFADRDRAADGSSSEEEQLQFRTRAACRTFGLRHVPQSGAGRPHAVGDGGAALGLLSAHHRPAFGFPVRHRLYDRRHHGHRRHVRSPQYYVCRGRQSCP